MRLGFVVGALLACALVGCSRVPHNAALRPLWPPPCSASAADECLSRARSLHQQADRAFLLAAFAYAHGATRALGFLQWLVRGDATRSLSLFQIVRAWLPRRAPLEEALDASCRSRDLTACLALGLLRHLEGRPVEALALHRAACLGGEPRSCSRWGTLAYDSPREAARAGARLYRPACDRGDRWACASLGWLQVEGLAVSRDLEQARALCDRACKAGELEGCTCLASVRTKAGESRQAAALLEQTCAAGETDACNQLAWMHRAGRGVSKDAARAAALFEISCRRGAVGDCSNLAGLYEKGEGVQRDHGAAARLYRVACHWGDLIACNNLAFLYEAGKGVPKDADKARELFRAACERGDAGACRNLTPTSRSSDGVKRR